MASEHAAVHSRMDIMTENDRWGQAVAEYLAVVKCQALTIYHSAAMCWLLLNAPPAAHCLMHAYTTDVVGLLAEV